MTDLAIDESWPPRSARHALLSSPSGRKKFADIEGADVTSPLKREPGTSNLLDRLRLARKDEDRTFISKEEEDDDDDEETLQLKLAAIEAKLKLKKLQTKARNTAEIASPRPATSVSGTSSQIEVALSPVRRQNLVSEQKSPSRVLLGIDKGVRGADVSLRRAANFGGSPTKRRKISGTGSADRTAARTSAPRNPREKAILSTDVTSFSERMSQVRGNDRNQGDKRGINQRARARKFKLDANEVEQFKVAAEKPLPRSRSPSPLRSQNSSLSKLTAHPTDQPSLRKAKTLPDLRSTSENQEGDPSLFEGHSGLHLSTRILPHSFLKRTLPSDQFTPYRIPDLLKDIVSPAYEIPDEVGDFVVFGVIASKSTPFDQKNNTDEKIKSSNERDKKWDDGLQNRKKFMVLTLTDLKWTIDLFLFDTALPRYYRMTPGTVIAILNPSIMPPKRGREDTGAFSLALHDGDNTVLEIGISKHLGYCNAVKKDGKECGQWVNAAKTEICEWHLNAQISKTQARRMGVNTGANGFGGSGSRNRHGGEGGNGEYGLLPNKQGRGFDRMTGSHYFVSSSTSGTRSAPVYNPNVSSARMLDLDEDLFVAEGQFSRDKEALLSKRMASQEKERSIAKKLAQLGSGDSAGANYMRRRVDGDSSLQPHSADVRQRNRRIPPATAVTHSETSTVGNFVENLRTEIGKKRTAEDVRLSPVKKKTRFLTEKGIKLAGRESVGSKRDNEQQYGHNDNNDDDDDLDII